MNLNLYDKNLNRISIIGNRFKSCLWKEGYNSAEPFTLELNPIDEYKQKLQKDFYIGRDDRPTLMVIKSVEFLENSIIVTGYQASRILDDVCFVGTISEGQNIDESIKNAYNESSGIQNLVFGDSSTGVVYEQQISNKSMLELCETMCGDTDCGFRAVKSENQVVVELYKPELNENLIFAENFGNLTIKSIYFSADNEKNYAIVLGEGEDENRIRVDVDLTNGNERKEFIVDARDIQQEEGETLDAYKTRLKARGVEKLLERAEIFTVSIVTSSADFGKKYDLGDILTIRMPDHNMTLTARVARFSQKEQNNQTETSIEVGKISKVKRRM